MANLLRNKKTGNLFNPTRHTISKKSFDNKTTVRNISGGALPKSAGKAVLGGLSSIVKGAAKTTPIGTPAHIGSSAGKALAGGLFGLSKQAGKVAGNVVYQGSGRIVKATGNAILQGSRSAGSDFINMSRDGLSSRISGSRPSDPRFVPSFSGGTGPIQHHPITINDGSGVHLERIIQTRRGIHPTRIITKYQTREQRLLETKLKNQQNPAVSDVSPNPISNLPPPSTSELGTLFLATHGRVVNYP